MGSHLGKNVKIGNLVSFKSKQKLYRCLLDSVYIDKVYVSKTINYSK